MAYGVTAAGFAKKTLSDIQAEIASDQRTLIDAAFDTSPNTPQGQIIGIVADKLREMWDVAEGVYRAMYPDSASGEALEQVASITRAVREKAQPSTVTLDRLFLATGTMVPANSVVSIGQNGARWKTLESVSNTSGYVGLFEVDAESEDTGPIQGLANTINVIQTSVSGWYPQAAIVSSNAETYDLADGQTLTVSVDGATADTATFNTADFADIDAATAAEIAAVINTDISGATAYDADGSVLISSDTEGEDSSIQVTGGTARTIIGFSTSISKGYNSGDAVPGRNLESDPEFRIRRIDVLRVIGAGTFESLLAAVKQVAGVTNATVLENHSNTTDSNGLPPKSFEVIVKGGAIDDICTAIFLYKPTGIESYGSSSALIKDSQGTEHRIYYSRPTEIPIYIALECLEDSNIAPSDWETQVENALVSYAQGLDIGEDVISLQFKCVPLTIAGIIDVTYWLIDDADPPVGSANIDISVRELATLSSADIDWYGPS